MPHPIEVRRVDGAGRIVPFGVPFRRIALRNANAAPATIRLTELTYDTPPAGERQQVVGVRTIAGRVVVPARTQRTITLTRPALGTVFAVPVTG
jgi:hypothetical protein